MNYDFQIKHKNSICKVSSLFIALTFSKINFACKMLPGKVYNFQTYSAMGLTQHFYPFTSIRWDLS